MFRIGFSPLLIVIALFGLAENAFPQGSDINAGSLNAAFDRIQQLTPWGMTPDQLNIRKTALGYLRRDWNAKIDALSQMGHEREAHHLVQRGLEILGGIEDVSQRRAGHLVLVGHHLYRDGRNFELAARTQLGPMQLLPLIVLRDTTAIELYAVLESLPTDSLDGFLYFGHSSSDGLFAGPKNLLLPLVWHEGLNISVFQFLNANSGSIYSTYLRPFEGETRSQMAQSLVRVMNREAKICLRGCSLGNEFAPKLNTALQDEACKIEACVGPMRFRYFREGDENLSPGDQPIPLDAQFAFLVPSPTVWQHIFGGTNWTTINETPELGTLYDRIAPTEPATSLRGLNEPYHFILSRLILGSSDRTYLSESAPVVFFSREETKILESLFKPWLEKDGLESDFGDRHFSRVYRENPEHRLLLDKVHQLVFDSRRLYYKPLPADAVLETEALKKSLGTLK